MFITLLKYSIYTAFFCGLLGACVNPNNAKRVMTYSSLAYNLQEPSVTFKLPKKLEEISGLTVYKDKWLIAVQDEKGTLFFLNIDNGKIEKTVDFSADGDYEDIICVGEALYAIRADGVLFRIDNWQDQDKVLTKVIDTNLGEINNTEGLTYWADSNDLWIICKESGLIGEEEHRFRSTFSYDLDSMEFHTSPLFSISRKQFKTYLKDSLKGKEDYSFFKKELKKAKKKMPIQPSAIAIHPIDKDIYILASVGNALLVLSPNYSIKSCHHLPSQYFEQPEGLTFNAQGDLYISSESKKKKARIYRFNYLSKPLPVDKNNNFPF